MTRRALVTGATGFIGRHLVNVLAVAGWSVRATSRSTCEIPGVDERVVVLPLQARPNWDETVSDVDTIFHLAGIVHQPDGSVGEVDYDLANVQATHDLAAAGASAGVRRFVFVSSVKVFGEESPRPWRSSDTPNPVDAYGRSKLRAERDILEVGRTTGMEVVIVRPPLVYGPGVGANFGLLMRVSKCPWPLPFASVDNRRSFVNVWNLCDFLLVCATHPKAVGRTWLVSDGDDVSTPELIRRCADSQGVVAKLVPFPTKALEALGWLFRRQPMVLRLTRSLVVDISESCGTLGWTPRVSMSAALRRTAVGAADRP